MIFVRLDENISHEVKGALEAIKLPRQGVIIETPKLLQEEGEKDVPWIKRFGERGRPGDVRIVISGDGAMRYREAERAALEEAGLITIFVPEPRFWRPLGRHGQAAFLLRWFPALLEIAASAKAGAHFRLPKSFTPTTDLRPLLRITGGRLAQKPSRKKREPKPIDLRDKVRLLV